MATDTDILKEARDVMSECEARESDNRAEAVSDLRFVAGEQWDAEWMGSEADRKRMKRAVLKVNQLPQYLNQVINDIRQNRPAIKARPVDDRADIALADIYEGIIRHGQDQGKAETARDIATYHSVTHGLGWYRLMTDYVDHLSFEQEPRYQGIDEPLNVYYDDFRELDGSDMRHCLILSESSLADFRAEYKDAAEVSWQDAQPSSDADCITLAEYYCIKTRRDSLLLLSDGQTILESEAKRRFEAGEPLPPLMRERKVDVPYVYWRKLSGAEMLEERELLGTFIPVFPVVGNVVRIEGKPIRFGLIRFARDPQRYYNWLKSAEVEWLENAPKAPWVGDARAFAPYEQYWKNANRVNYSYMPVAGVDDQGQPIPGPQRNPPAQIPAGLMQAELAATDDIKKSMGMYSAALGAQGNEQSGRAIFARQHESDTGTFHYADNLAKTVLHEGRLLMQWIPRLYGARQVARIIGMDDEPQTVRLTQTLPQAATKVRTSKGVETVYNLGVGKYDVTVTVGPSYSTKRAEAATMMTEMVRADPTLMQKAGDIVIRNYDIPGGEELAERLKAFLPPQVLQSEQDEDEQSPEQMRMAMAQVQQAMAQVQARTQALQEIEAKMGERDQKLSEEGQKIAAERTQLQAEKAVLEARAREIQATIELKARTAQESLRQAAEQAMPAASAAAPAQPADDELRRIQQERAELARDEREAALRIELQAERAKSALRPLAEQSKREQTKPAPAQAPAPESTQERAMPQPQPVDLSAINDALTMLLQRPAFDPDAVMADVRSLLKTEMAKQQKAIAKQIADSRTVRVVPVMDDDGNMVGGEVVSADGKKHTVQLETADE